MNKSQLNKNKCSLSALIHILLSEVLHNSLTLSYYSPTGAHVEWCKQLIAATMSSPISGSISSETISRECKVCVCASVYIIIFYFFKEILNADLFRFGLHYFYKEHICFLLFWRYSWHLCSLIYSWFFFLFLFFTYILSMCGNR